MYYIDMASGVKHMEQPKKKISKAQKEAQQRYDKYKTKMVPVKYTGKDMDEYFEFQDYLLKHPEQSANRLIKNLIYQFLREENNKTRTQSQNMSGINIYEGIEAVNLESLRVIAGRETTDRMLEYYRDFLQNEIIEINRKEVNNWIKNYPKVAKHSETKLTTIGLEAHIFGKFMNYLDRIKAKIHI